jgi:CubicO group peptidase (beta-lactamase class C family)
MRFLSLLTVFLTACTSVRGEPTFEPARAAVAFDLDRETGALADGLADPATGRLVTPDDPARIASVSKLVVAIGVMKLVEEGKLDLDRPVGDWLGYKVENPAFPGQPVTLRHLLSHLSSIRDEVDYAIPLGASLRDILADPKAWDAKHGPRSGFFTYSNLNFPVVASVMEAATGERFDRLMQRLAIGPMKLGACFNWPTCGDDRVARAVVLTQQDKPVRDDLGGKRPPCPVVAAADGSCDLKRWRAGENGALFSPQGGLRISVRDLARVGRMLLNRGTLDGVRILAPESVDALLRAQWQFDGRNGKTEGGTICAYGLATLPLATRNPGCADDPGVPPGDWRGHSGEAYGLRSGLWIDRMNGRGIAYFTTGLDDKPFKGRSDYTAAEEAMVEKAVSLLPQRP